MRFNDEYRKEMNKKTLSEDFIKNLAARMAEEAAGTQNTETENPKTDTEIKTEQKETEVKVVEYRRNRTMMSVKIAAVACAAAVTVIFGANLKNKSPRENISVTPDISQTANTSQTEVTAAESEAVSAVQTPVTSIVTVTEINPEISAQTEAAVTEISAVTEETTVQDNPEKEYDDSYYLENINEILEAFKTIDSIPAGGIGLEKDMEDSFFTDTEQYARVTDSRFTAPEDIENYMNTYLTEKMAASESRVKDCFTVQNGNLYIVCTGRGYKYVWNTDYAPEITEKSESSFTFIQAYYIPGESDSVGRARISMVKSDSHPGWKIDSVEDITE